MSDAKRKQIQILSSRSLKITMIHREHEKYKWEVLDAIKNLQMCALEVVYANWSFHVCPVLSYHPLLVAPGPSCLHSSPGLLYT